MRTLFFIPIDIGSHLTCFTKDQTDNAAGMGVRATDRRWLQPCRPGMKVALVRVVGAGHGGLDTLNEELRERKRTVRNDIQFFFTQVLEKWNCHCVLERCKFWGEDDETYQSSKWRCWVGIHVWSTRREGSSWRKNLGVISEQTAFEVMNEPDERVWVKESK